MKDNFSILTLLVGQYTACRLDNCQN